MSGPIVLPCQLHVGHSYLVCHGGEPHLEWDRVKELERLPQLCMVLLAPCSKEERPAMIPAACPGGFLQPLGCTGDRQMYDLQFTALLFLLWHPGMDGDPIPVPCGGTDGTLHRCLPGDSCAPFPTAVLPAQRHYSLSGPERRQESKLFLFIQIPLSPIKLTKSHGSPLLQLCLIGK